MARLFDIPEGTDKIAIRKRINIMLSEARRRAKPGKCILCGQNKSSFCNSHSVPQMSLRGIANNGIVLHASAVMGFDFEIIDLEKGVNNSGTFNFICQDGISGTYFHEGEWRRYENRNVERLVHIGVRSQRHCGDILKHKKRQSESSGLPLFSWLFCGALEVTKIQSFELFSF